MELDELLDETHLRCTRCGTELMALRYAGYQERMETGEHEYVFTTIPCPKCRGQENIAVKAPDLYRYQTGGAHIQNAFPYLTADQRERLMSGYCEKCFAEIFKEEE